MFFTLLRYLWASPNTLLGLALALLARTTGGAWQTHTGVVEAHGGAVCWLLQRAPFVRGGAAAITFGHVVLAQERCELDRTRVHERVHVAQYGRWGPLFLPAYLAAGAWQRLRGRDPYRDNPFEVPAYAAGDAAQAAARQAAQADADNAGHT
ncbi:hypothetical protein OT109_10955 [Phycisphaeraceae bacterium D3-23]